MYDYVVIGGGIVGSLIARELSKYDLKTLVLDKENDVANVQTRANSAIVHSGHDPKPNTLKASLCVRGNQLYETLEKELNISLLYTGAFVCAHNQDEERDLQELYNNAKTNGVTSFELLSGDHARMIEPNLNETVTKVLSLPSTKVCFPWEVAYFALENAIKNGVELKKNFLVKKIVYNDDIYVINDSVKTKHIINAAGVHADDIAHLLIKDLEYQITPRKGEYFVLDRSVKGFINHVLYPLPTDKGKGVLITPQVHGNILIGPTSEWVDDKDKVDTTQPGLNYIRTHAKALATDIPYHLSIRQFAGVRATSTYHDFYIKEDQRFQGFYHVAGIDSPGLTAAPAIAEYLIKDIIKINQAVKPSFNPYLKKKIVFKDLNDTDKKALQKEKPLYGRIVCKCEQISEQEIIDAIHGPLGSHTIKGIKKRARAGSGLCQGGYCESEILRLISRETNTPLDQINYDEAHTEILRYETKVSK